MAKEQERLTAKFSIEPSNFKNSAAVLVYEWLEGMTWELRSISWSEGCTPQVKMATVREVPIRIVYQRGEPVERFQMWVRTGCKVNDISNADYSFERFWNLYGYKVGSKDRVKKKWDRLPEGEKILALGSIPRYRRFAESKHIEMAYPETYIDQRRWENEFTNN